MGTWDWIKDTLDPGDLLHQNDVAPQPGVTANGESNTGNLQRDPVTGLYMDPITGNVFTDQYAKMQVTNPNVAQQVATNFQQSQALLGMLPGARQDARLASNGQGQLIQDLNGVISGSAPSVAGTQLAGTLGNIQRTQSAIASGYGGANAFAARQAAARNIGAAQQQASQNAAALRAQEVQGAIGAKGGVLANMASNANEQAAQDIAGAGAFSQLASKGQQAQQGMNTEADKANTDESNDKAQRLASSIGSLWSIGGGRSSGKK